MKTIVQRYATVREIAGLMRAFFDANPDLDPMRDHLRIARLVLSLARFSTTQQVRLAHLVQMDTATYPVTHGDGDGNVRSFRAWLEDVKGLPHE